MLSKSNISFNVSACPEEQILRDYQKGVLSKEQNRVVENHLADCEMCSDYIEGFALLSNENELENEAQLIVAKIYNKSSKKNKIWLYATAASLFLAVAFTTLILLLPNKNNFVADKTVTNLPKEEKPETGAKQLENLGWTKDATETSGKNLPEKQIAEKNNIDSRVTNVSAISDEVVDIVTVQEEIKLAEEDNSVLANQNIVSEVDKVSVLKDQEQQQVKSPGYFDRAKESASDEKKLEKEGDLQVLQSKSNKKAKEDLAGYKKEESKSVVAGATFSLQTSSPAATGESTITTTAGLTDLSKNSDVLVSDLDKANDFLNTDKPDSAVVYALRGVTSVNDNIKWKSKLCLAKAYIAKGEKDKAVAILKEIRSKASYRISKDADAELEKLGN
ncbi:MAG: hypothetical protein HY951_14030 [Bacteroidia bacterium]|nr:hypothetical protein [Bacteroidia bacterium]